MARKDAMMGLRQILVRRRDALRQALAGDLSLLKELRQQNSGDVIDAALDTAQDEISSQLAEVESRLARLTALKTELERMVVQCAGDRISDCRVIEVLGDHSLCVTNHPKIDDAGQ